eukprot:190141-Rhodomonas_salina.1
MLVPGFAVLSGRRQSGQGTVLRLRPILLCGARYWARVSRYTRAVVSYSCPTPCPVLTYAVSSYQAAELLLKSA